MHKQRREKWRVKGKRLWLVFTNGINQFLPPVCQLLLSFFIVRQGNLSLWGNYVALLLIPSLLLQVTVWGNKEYLLRTFAQKPQEIAFQWQNNVLARLPVFCLMAILYVFLPNDTDHQGWLIGWMLGQFCYQSFQVLFLYNRSFTASSLLELFGFLLTAAAVWYAGEALTMIWLLQVTCLVTGLKVMVSGILFPKAFSSLFANRFHFRSGLVSLKKSGPFFLLSLVGMLAYKMDVYTIKYLLPKPELGQYFLLNTALFQIQGFSNIILQPFLKNRYRLSAASVDKLELLFVKIGLLLPIPALAGSFLLFHYFYKITFVIDLYLLGYFYVIPVFLYVNLVYGLLRQSRQRVVTIIFFLGSLLNLGGCILLVPHYGIKGALLSGVIMQWLILAMLAGCKKTYWIPKRKRFSLS
jgi:O-antigen/teichoic acid export membrane protein